MNLVLDSADAFPVSVRTYRIDTCVLSVLLPTTNVIVTIRWLIMKITVLIVALQFSASDLVW